MTQIVLTTYLTGNPDPQSGRFVPVDSDEKVALWMPGMKRLELHGVVFHDSLSDEFVSRHETDRIRFVKTPTSKDYSNNDYRFFVYRDWLAMNPAKSVFCVDLFDVRVNRSPHALVSDDFHLWVGIERDWLIDSKTPDGRWMVRKLTEYYGNVPDAVESKNILTAGHWGGSYSHVLRLLVLLTSEISRLSSGPANNCNMAAFNTVLYRDIGEQFLWKKGAPLHSVFRAYDAGADVCFVHK